jgi:S-adenosylmethionine hydrolase
MAKKQPIITLLTDFGLQDHFVGTMKGVIASINPEALVIDITHDVVPHDIFQAAFLIKSTYQYFPPSTIHVVVVDPGVGTNRRALIVSSERGYFIAPDNGVLSYIYADEGIGEVREITADHYFLKPRTGTFDGRDVFGPVAAWMSKGVGLSSLGEPIEDYKKYDLPKPEPVGQGAMRCKILYIDRFGNLVSNLTQAHFEELLDASEKRRFAFQVGEHTIGKISSSYTEGNDNEIIAIFGSTGFLEFSANKGNAFKLTGIGAGKDFFVKVA